MSFSVALPRRFSSIQMDLAFEIPSHAGLAVLVGRAGIRQIDAHQRGGRPVEVTLPPM